MVLSDPKVSPMNEETGFFDWGFGQPAIQAGIGLADYNAVAPAVEATNMVVGLASSLPSD